MKKEFIEYSFLIIGYDGWGRFPGDDNRAQKSATGRYWLVNGLKMS